MTVVCFLIEPTGEVVPTRGIMEPGPCPAGGAGTYHRATVEADPELERSRPWAEGGALIANVIPDDLTAPETCDGCGHRFTDDATVFGTFRRVWRRVDDPTVIYASPHEAGPGAMWDASWMPDDDKGPDGRCLVAITPDGTEWMIDGPARNCTRPGEDHDCWCRHGEPPTITVDKYPEPGRSTCTAGAGSIATPGYHGFLRDGRFT